MVKQKLAINDLYDVLTPNGWEDFVGVVQNNGEQQMIKFTLENNQTIVSTLDHRYHIDGKPVKAKNLEIGDYLQNVDGNILITNKEYTLRDKTYDVFDTTSHTVVYSNVHSFQCDEFAFVQPNIADDFWAAVQPVLSCVSGDTLVLSQDGFKRIEEYHYHRKIGDYFEINDQQVYGMNGMEFLSHGYVSPESETLIFTTENGRRLEVTHNHPLWAITGTNDPEMIKATNLGIGDKLRVQLGMNVYGKGESHATLNDALVANKENQLEYLKSVFTTNEYDSDTITLVAIQLMLSNNNIDSVINGLTIIITYDDFKMLHSGNIKKLGYDYKWEKIVDITPSHCVTYDFTVPETHTFLQNGLLGSNTGGSCVITSTPQSDEDKFAQIWRAANDNLDEHGNPLPDGLGKNGFFPFLMSWDKHPDRDEKWKNEWMQKLGEARFRQEMACVSGETKLELLSDNDTKIQMTVAELYEILGEDDDED